MEVFAFTDARNLPHPKPNELIWYCGKVNDTDSGFWCVVANGGWRLTYNAGNKTISTGREVLARTEVLVFRKECPPKHELDYNEAIWWGMQQYKKHGST